MLYYKKISSPLGEITLRSDGESLTGLWFADDKASAHLLSYFMKELVSQGQEQDAVAAFSKAQRNFITDCKEGKNPLGYPSPPLHPYFWAVGALFGK